METLKQILDQYEREEHLSFMGRDYVVSPGRNLYTHHRIKYVTLAHAALLKYKQCEQSFKTVDDLLDNFADAFAVALEETMDTAVKDFISVGVYDLDHSAVFERAEKNGAFDKVADAIKVYIDGSEMIRSRLSQNAAQRERAKANRARWNVTTIGGDMLDAVGDQMKAGALNAMSGAGASVKNMFAAAADEADAERKLDELFQNSKYRAALRNGVWNASYYVSQLFLDFFPNGTTMSSSDIQNAIALCNNVINLDLPEEQRQEMIFQCLTHNPYRSETYDSLYDKFPDYRQDLVRFARFFGVASILIKAASSVTDFVKANLGTTEQDAKKCRILTIDYIKWIGLKPNDCMEAFQIMDAQDQKLDREFRTVRGVTMETREQAASARSDIENYDDILETKQAFLTMGDYHAHIEKVSALPMDENVKRSYVQQYQSKLNAFEKTCKKAKKYAYVRNHQFLPFYNGAKLDMIIHYCILAYLIFCLFIALFRHEDSESVAIGNFLVIGFSVYMFIVKVILSKGSYDKVTQNGKYQFEQILSEDTGDKLYEDPAGQSQYKVHPVVIGMFVFMVLFAGVSTILSPAKAASGTHGNGYRGSAVTQSTHFESAEVVEELASAMERRDAMDVMDVFLPEILSTGMTSADVQNTQNALNAMTSIDMEVIAEEPLDSETIEKIRVEYMGIGVLTNITKGYRTTINVLLDGQPRTVAVHVLYLEGEGWKIYFNDIMYLLG
ncbi:MAG: hypothetical protein K5695_14700 [Oscillospiraceae bacterium]|nr:hypothetical protein [Oscillospiraceae bacterium]